MNNKMWSQLLRSEVKDIVHNFQLRQNVTMTVKNIVEYKNWRHDLQTIEKQKYSPRQSPQAYKGGWKLN